MHWHRRSWYKVKARDKVLLGFLKKKSKFSVKSEKALDK